MRVVLLLAATALAVSACTTAQGATGGSPDPATTPTAGADMPSTPASAAPAPGSNPNGSPSPSVPALAAGSPTIASPSASASPSPSPTPTSVVDPTVVGQPAPVGALVLGDSISLGIAAELSRYGYPVIGLVGQSATASYLRMHLSTPLAQAADAWVIVLGTNNSGSPTDVAMLEDLVDVIDSLRTPGAKQQVRWVTPHRPASYVGTKTAYNLDAFNAELSRLSSENRWLRILDFDVLAKANPDWFDADTAMHLHPDSRGQAALVDLITGPVPRPADSPAAVLDGAPQPTSSQPETFDNSTMPPSTPLPLTVAPSAEPTSEPEPSDEGAGENPASETPTP